MIALNSLSSSWLLFAVSLGSPDAVPAEAEIEAAPLASEGEASPASEAQPASEAPAVAEVSDEDEIFAESSQPRSEPPPRPPQVEDLPPKAMSAAAVGPRGARYLGAATRRWFIHAATGGSRPIRNPEYDIVQRNSLLLEQAIGVHLDKQGYGAALAFVTQQAFTEPFNTYVFGLRYQHDVAVDPDLGVYLSPVLTLGYRRVTDRGTENFSLNCPPDVPIDCEAEIYNQATIQLGLGLTVVIADRLPLFIRPINLDLGLPHIEDGDDNAPVLTVRWQILGGLGLSF